MRPSKDKKLYDQAYQLLRRQNYHAASRLIHQLLAKPNPSPSTWYLSANLHFQTNNFSQALAHLDQIQPGRMHQYQYYQLKAKIYFSLSNPTAALDHLQTGMSLFPDDPTPYLDIHALHLSRSNLSQARQILDLGLSHCPHHPGLLAAKAQTYLHQDKPARAHHYWQLAHQADHRNFFISLNLAQSFHIQGHLPKALHLYRQLLIHHQKQPQLVAQAYQLARAVLAWDLVDTLAPTLNTLTQTQLKSNHLTSENPFANIIRTRSKSQNLAVAQNYSQSFLLNHPQHSFPIPPHSSSQLNVLYFTCNAGNHPVGYQAYPLTNSKLFLKFNTHIVSYGPNDHSFVHNYFKQNSTTFHHCYLNPDSQITTLFQTLAPQMIIDLTGHTEQNRMRLLAPRHASIQIAFLGFPSSTGANFFDYLVSDNIITPPSDNQFYTEQFILLPHSYQPCPTYPTNAQSNANSRSQDTSQLQLAIFNNTFKLTRDFIKQIIKISQSVSLPHQFQLVSDHQLVKNNFKAFLKINHIPSSKFRFLPRIALEDHLHRYSNCALALDTHRYNGGSTTANSLQMGCPVVTKAGNRYVERMSASMLLALGIGELITHTDTDYQRLAITLINNPTKLARIRAKLASHLANYPLFNTTRFIKNFEQGLLRVWDRYLAGHSPTPTRVTDPLPLISSATFLQLTA